MRVEVISLEWHAQSYIHSVYNVTRKDLYPCKLFNDDHNILFESLRGIGILGTQDTQVRLAAKIWSQIGKTEGIVRTVSARLRAWGLDIGLRKHDGGGCMGRLDVELCLSIVF